MERYCEAAGLPYVCPHGLEGTAASAMADDGGTAERIVAYLSQEKATTSKRHYGAEGSIEAGQAIRSFEALIGDRS